MLTRRIGLATDLYELTMAAAYFQNGINHEASFELSTRWLPPHRGYLVLAGIPQVVEYLKDLRFEGPDIDFLRRQPTFARVDPKFFDFLAGLRFTGALWAMPEGTPFFAHEPVLRVTSPIIEAQILETYLLSVINFQTSIATKAARIVQAAAGRPVIEFGARRAHGMEAALYAARAAYIGGCAGTSNVEAGFRFEIPIYGTAAHSWTMAFDEEIDAFRSYMKVFPESTTLLIDTYDTVDAARTVTRLQNTVNAVRIDSGDITKLSRQVRTILDAAGMKNTKIVASGDLDELRILELLADGAPLDIFGVGTQLSTSYDAPTLGGVYKLVEQRKGEEIQYKMKLSEAKQTYPGGKQVWRCFGELGQADNDIIGLANEPGPPGGRRLLDQVLSSGKLVARLPPLQQVREQASEWIGEMPAPIRDLKDPARYRVDFSPELERLRNMVELKLIEKRRK